MINLLPPTERERIYSFLFKKQLYVFAVVIAIIFFGGAIFVLNTLIFIKIQTKELKQNINSELSTKETVYTKDLEGEVKTLNLQLSKYKSFRDKSVSLGTILNEISNIIPPAVSLTVLNIDIDSKKITALGKAETRDSIVLMEDNIKKSKIFEKIDSPLTNYLQKNNAPFSFSFYLK